jgi:hypothetical protein
MKHISTARSAIPRGVVRRPSVPTLARNAPIAGQLRRADDSDSKSDDDDKDKRRDDDKDSDGD